MGIRGRIWRKMLFWVLWHVPLGRLAPWVMGLALGRMPRRVRDQKDV